jgi:hypothetical protein
MLLLAGKGEDAVAFSNAGNATPNKMKRSVNADKEAIKMPRSLLARD